MSFLEASFKVGHTILSLQGGMERGFSQIEPLLEEGVTNLVKISSFYDAFFV